MEKELAKQIITEYVFSDYKIESLYKFVDVKINDELQKKLYAESLLTKALQKAVIALNIQRRKEYEKKEDKIKDK